MTRYILLAALTCLGLFGQSHVLLILHKGGSTLGFYTPEGKLMTDLPVGRHPHEMVLASDGRHLYITDNGTMKIEEVGTGGNTISIVDLKARKRIGEISLGKFRRPHGIDLDPKTGRLLVSCELPDRLVVVDPKTRSIVRDYDTKGKTAHMVTLGPGGKFAYVSNSSSANVAAIDLASGAVKLIPTGERPEDSVLASDGKLYVTNREAASISVIDTAKNAVSATIKTGKGPVRIALTPDQRTLVYALIHEDKFEFADRATGKILGQTPVKGHLVSMSVCPDGKLAFASAEEIDTVYAVSVADRKIVRTIKTAKGSGPDPAMEVILK